MAALEPDELRRLLCRLGDHIRDEIVRVRGARTTSAGREQLAAVAGATAADTMYEIDRVSDRALLSWFASAWPIDEPVELVTEGLDHAVVIPEDTDPTDIRWTCIVDPVDGTRGLMYDKRSAWVLAAVAPYKATGARLGEVVAAAMTEIPVVKQWGADQVSGVRGCGRAGLVAERTDIFTGARASLEIRPSEALDLEHGWASFARFFPTGKALMAAFEERLWSALYDHGRRTDVAIFDDQYLATGGQFHELLAGHDRMLGDLRPLAAAELGMPTAMACHPYDCCVAMLLEEAGCVVTTPWGSPLDVPLDILTPVSWVAYANPQLAAQVQPVVYRLLEEMFPSTIPTPRSSAAR